mmetsp:Transcript_34332/g.60112  ORF Transcript_34332/g.60112 Transcript_34332/m.60112 type:complete len:686 (-) Transcript_34332:842-2899(-)
MASSISSMSYSFNFLTQFIPGLFEPNLEDDICPLPPYGEQIAKSKAETEAEQLYADAERRLNSELASIIEVKSPRDVDHKELNEAKQTRRLKEKQLKSLQLKLKELESDTRYINLAKAREMEEGIATAAQSTAEIEIDNKKYAHVKKRTEILLTHRQQQGRMLEEQVQQVNWRLDQAQRLYNENEIAAKTLLEKMHSYIMLTEKAQANRIKKLSMRLEAADEMRSGLEKAKKLQILKMMPTKEQLASQNKLKLRMDHVKDMQNVMIQAKLVRDLSINKLERQFTDIKKHFGTGDPANIVDMFEDTITQGKCLEQQLEEYLKQFEKLASEKKSYEDELSYILTDSEPVLPQVIGDFLEKRGLTTQAAENRMKLMRRNSEHAYKMLSNMTLVLSNLYTIISEYDNYDLTCPDYQLLQLTKAEGGLVFSNEQLFKLLLILQKKLGMMSEVIDQRKKRYKLFGRRGFGKALGMALLKLAKGKSYQPKDLLAKHAFKSHFTRKSSDANLNSGSVNKISEMIKGYAQIETQKVIRGGYKGIKQSKALQQLFKPLDYNEETEQDESIAVAQLRVKQDVKEKALSPKLKVPTLDQEVSTISKSKDWKDALKRELKTMDSELQMLSASTHRTFRSIDASSNSRLNFPSAFEFQTPRPKRTTKLPEIGYQSVTPKNQKSKQLKYSLSTVSRFLPK